MQILAALISLMAGILSGLQGVFNNQIGKDWNLPTMILAVSLVQSALAFIWLQWNGSFRLSVFLQWRVFIAGILGVVIMAAIAWSISNVGALLAFALVIFGQLLFSTFVDSFGLLGMVQKLMTPMRATSLGLIGLGTLLLLRSR